MAWRSAGARAGFMLEANEVVLRVCSDGVLGVKFPRHLRPIFLGRRVSGSCGTSLLQTYRNRDSSATNPTMYNAKLDLKVMGAFERGTPFIDDCLLHRRL